MRLEYTQDVQGFFELMLREGNVDILVDHYPPLVNPLTLFEHGVRLQGLQELISFPYALQDNHCLTRFFDCIDRLFPGQNYQDAFMNYPMNEGSLLEREQAQNQQDIEIGLNHLAVVEQHNPPGTPPINFQQTPPVSPALRRQAEQVCPWAPKKRPAPYDLNKSQTAMRRHGAALFNIKEDGRGGALADLMIAQEAARDLFSGEGEPVKEKGTLAFKA